MKTLKSYYKRKSETTPSTCTEKNSNCAKRSKVDADLENLLTDSELKTPISKYDPNIRDQV